MNEQKPPNAIEWTRVYGRRGWTWNPVAGCHHGCRWTMPDGAVAECYAENVAEGVAQKAYPNGFDHHYWHPEILEQPLKLKEPGGIFVGSMADLFGAWVPEDQINQVLDVCRRAHWHTFILLTKNIPRALKFGFPSNVWVGVSSPPDQMHGKPLNQKRQIAMLRRSLGVLRQLRLRGVMTWLSAEPLSWDISPYLIDGALDWCVIGAASDGRRQFPPSAEAFKNTLAKLDGFGVATFFKGNLKSLPEAAADWREAFPVRQVVPLLPSGKKIEIKPIPDIRLPSGYAQTLTRSDPPVLRYLGGKHVVADWVIEKFPPHRCYVELFAGGATVALRKQPAQMTVINDLDGEVVNFFRVLREQPEALVRVIELTPYSRAEYLLSHDPSDDLLEKARRFYVRLWQSFGHATQKKKGWRVHKSESRFGDDPFTWSRLDHLYAAASIMKGWYIEQEDALQVFARYDAHGTLFYVDPPYLSDARVNVSGAGYLHEMTNAQHEALLKALIKARGCVAISGYINPLYEYYLVNWRRFDKAVMTNGGGKAVESLWMSPNSSAVEALPLFAHLNK